MFPPSPFFLLRRIQRTKALRTGARREEADDAAAGHHHEQRRLDGRGRKADEGEQHNRDERRSCDAASAIRRRKRCEELGPADQHPCVGDSDERLPDQVQWQSRSEKQRDGAAGNKRRPVENKQLAVCKEARPATDCGGCGKKDGDRKHAGEPEAELRIGEDLGFL